MFFSCYYLILNMEKLMMLTTFLKKTDFTSYEDFFENFKVNIPESFNFAYHVVDVIAETNPKRALVPLTNSRAILCSSFGVAPVSIAVSAITLRTASI